ncbi:hypothetical protein FA13DRAFT_1362041 [Coprinellus micaceus]|uniref:Uncharacterized protein n=1 Tax=Coprinellus micaceus TaxID=71717 RepID=A0A4Y7TN93_COPMI|nr:hypothetical protein FA13DRAFT_1362041 [Coprinellus micaceus]
MPGLCMDQRARVASGGTNVVAASTGANIYRVAWTLGDDIGVAISVVCWQRNITWVSWHAYSLVGCQVTGGEGLSTRFRALTQPFSKYAPFPCAAWTFQLVCVVSMITTRKSCEHSNGLLFLSIPFVIYTHLVSLGLPHPP